jgi:hypothetical protein
MVNSYLRIGRMAALAAALGVAGKAGAVCWNETSAAAATIRDLQSRLMVGTLRCNAYGLDITEPYNRFVRSNRVSLQAANAAIKAQLAADGAASAEQRYDSFTTALANQYGAAATSGEVCAELANLALEAAEAAGDQHALVALAERYEARPALPDGRCAVPLASISLD